MKSSRAGHDVIRLSAILISALVAAPGWFTSTAIDAQQTSIAGKPLPFDLAFHQRTLGDVVLSSDETLVAYSVHEPPARSTGGVRYLPNGVPGSIPNRSIVVSEIATGKTWPVASDGGNCWRPSFSHDGTQLAFYCDAGGAPHVWLYNIPTKASHQLGSAVVKPQLWPGDEPEWSPDDKEVFVPLMPPSSGETAALRQSHVEPGMKQPGQGTTVTVHLAGKELSTDTMSTAPRNDASTNAEMAASALREYNATLAAIDVRTGNVRTVVPASATPAPNVLQLSPSGRWVAYLSVIHQPSASQAMLLQDIAVAPAAGGPVQVVAPDLPATVFLAGAYIWHPTRDQLFWIKDGHLWMADMATSPVHPRQLAPTLHVTPGAISVTRDGGAIVVGIQPLDHPGYGSPHSAALAVVPLNGAAPTVVTIPAWLRLQQLVRQRGVTLWQPQPDAITMVGTETATGGEAIVRLSLTSEPPRTLWKGVAALSPVGASADYNQLVGTFEDMNTPGDLYRFSADFNQKHRMSQLEPRLADVRFGPAEVIETEVRKFDGSTVKVSSTILLPPDTKRGDHLPTVVVVYPRSAMAGANTTFGGGDAADIPAAIYTTRGYAVLLTAAPVRAVGDTGHIIADLRDVIEPQVRHAVDLGYTDPRRIAVTGHSFGGYSTAALLSATNMFRAGIANAGVYDLPYVSAYMGPDGGFGSAPGKLAGYWNLGGDLLENLPRYLDASPFFRANRIQAPLLMMHGTNDEICPIEDARLMFNGLRTLGKTVQLAEYAGEGHNLDSWSLVNATDAARRIIAFLDKYVGATNTPTSDAGAQPKSSPKI